MALELVAAWLGVGVAAASGLALLPRRPARRWPRQGECACGPLCGAALAEAAAVAALQERASQAAAQWSEDRLKRLASHQLQTTGPAALQRHRAQATLENRMTPQDLAQVTTLAALNAAVRNIIARAPALESRALRAASIVALGDLYQAPAIPGHWHVAGGSDQPYTVVLSATQRSCDCQDWANGVADRPNGAPRFASSHWCKHLIACCVAQRLLERAQAGPARKRRQPTAVA